jgi:hypothetical protein
MPRQAAASQGFAAANGSTRASLSPPGDLNELERIEFVNVVLGSPPSHFLPCDVATIAMYARAVVAERIAAGELQAAPVISSPTGDRPSPWLPIWLAAVRTCTTTARRLNIGPAGRIPTKSPEPHEPVSYYEKMRMLEDRRDDH